MQLIIKNMVCQRCIMTVDHILKENGLQAESIKLGEVELATDPSEEQLQKLSKQLEVVGFELLDDQKKQVIERIKTLLIEKVQEGNIEDHFSVSKFLTARIYKDYSSISRLFSEVEGITIEQFLILQKIEKIKEWLIYNEIPLSTMAVNLGYSSSQHLSNQFKKLTGMTPTGFKKIGAKQRKSLDSVKA